MCRVHLESHPRSPLIRKYSGLRISVPELMKLKTNTTTHGTSAHTSVKTAERDPTRRPIALAATVAIEIILGHAPRSAGSVQRSATPGATADYSSLSTSGEDGIVAHAQHSRTSTSPCL